MSELKVDSTKYPQLLEENLEIQVFGDKDVIVKETQYNVSVDADTKDNLQANWAMAQEALAQAIEYIQSAQGNAQPERGGYL